MFSEGNSGFIQLGSYFYSLVINSHGSNKIIIIITKLIVEICKCGDIDNKKSDGVRPFWKTTQISPIRVFCCTQLHTNNKHKQERV